MKKLIIFFILSGILLFNSSVFSQVEIEPNLAFEMAQPNANFDSIHDKLDAFYKTHIDTIFSSG